jgi:outer membrane lipase/esterase
VTPNWLVGAAFSGLTTTQSFSLGGNYRQDEFAASLYTVYRRSALWTNAVLSWGTIHDTVNRQIPLGITQQPNLSTTSGSNVSLAGEIGYEFATAFGKPPAAASYVTKAPVAAAMPLVLTHGPVVGIILQQVYVNAFTETNPSGVPTALAFGAQTRNSAVTEFGYQARVSYGIWEPYAKFVWDHEWADLNRQVAASLTSIAAPGFTMPAVILGRYWASATLGTRIKLAANVFGYAAATAEVGQNNATVYGGQIGLNVALNPAAIGARY